MGNTHVEYMRSIVVILSLLWLQTQSSLFNALAASPMRRIYSGLELLLLDCILPRYVNFSTGSTVLPSTIIGDGVCPEPRFWIFVLVQETTVIRRPRKPHPRTKHKVDLMTRGGDIVDFHCACAFPPYLYFRWKFWWRISIRTPISYTSWMVTVALFGLSFQIQTWDGQTTDDIHQTTDKRLHCLRCPTCYYRWDTAYTFSM